MKDYSRKGVMLAATLSALAGYVDAVGFMTLGGFFVSFMSGIRPGWASAWPWANGPRRRSHSA
ncbi:DUF1275 family protein [Brevundimonas sp.]|uniref:DUF1275 family protein n=1 Tax=Brevundimonas sp. TaxID=1871086 RepID=UPI003563F800